MDDFESKSTSGTKHPRVIALFDVDGTLTQPRGEITKAMMEFLEELSKCVVVGIVGGSDLPKQEEQLGKGIVTKFPYNFSQNGLVAYKDGVLLEEQTLSKFLGEENLKRLINWTLRYIADLDIPIKVKYMC
jgi:phosphomannomutase